MEGMGWLQYDHISDPIAIDDRALSHLKTVITTKLRRGESFTVTWIHSTEQKPGRTTIWVDPAIPLRFTFDSADPVELNPEWLVRLADTASMTGEIVLIPEEESGPLTIPPAP